MLDIGGLEGIALPCCWTHTLITSWLAPFTVQTTGIPLLGVGIHPVMMKSAVVGP